MAAASLWLITLPRRNNFTNGHAMKRATTATAPTIYDQRSTVRVLEPKWPTCSSNATTRKNTATSPMLYNTPRISRSL